MFFSDQSKAEITTTQNITNSISSSTLKPRLSTQSSVTLDEEELDLSLDEDDESELIDEDFEKNYL